MPKHKKQKLCTVAVADDSPKSCHFTKLPIELLAEVLLYTKASSFQPYKKNIDSFIPMLAVISMCSSSRSLQQVSLRNASACIKSIHLAILKTELSSNCSSCPMCTLHRVVVCCICFWRWAVWGMPYNIDCKPRAKIKGYRSAVTKSNSSNPMVFESDFVPRQVVIP